MINFVDIGGIVGLFKLSVHDRELYLMVVVHGV